jgi:hypothetical protein
MLSELRDGFKPFKRTSFRLELRKKKEEEKEGKIRFYEGAKEGRERKKGVYRSTW